MSTATSSKVGKQPQHRPAPAKCCSRCGSAILSYVQILELSRLTHRGPETDKAILCCGCADAIRSYM